mmetsp:Transcript_20042/g.49420  ORF Transcript_20042/g.49420 Transcript_20042/m.49420 type:complete len:145 (+) Transcript_20042:17-451(+)
MAMFEPLVDVVDPNQVCTSTCKILEMDIQTATLDDLVFQARYALTVNRPDFIHALVAYFDVTFSHCHKPVVLPTGPQVISTHWKQTVFYLDDPLVASFGEELSGAIAVRPNESNPRDLEIKLTVDFAGEKQPSEVHLEQEYRMR